MLIYGAGGHSKVVRSILAANGVLVQAIFDDDAPSLSASGMPLPQAYDPLTMSRERLIIAVGNNADRMRLANLVHHAFGNAIHPSAIVDEAVAMGVGVVVAQAAVIQPGSQVGYHAIINTAAIVEHDCFLDDFVHIGPGATLCGNVRIGKCSLVGAASVILPGVQVGAGCVIGAGSVVIHHVPDFAKVAGNPARIIS